MRSPVATGWFPDPLRRFEFRYFNGQRWTAAVSVDGDRFVDPNPFSPPVAEAFRAPRPDRHAGRHPSRTLAVLSAILGLAGLALAWAPFIFVLGGAGSIAAIILGVVSRRRTDRLAAAGTRDPSGSGRRLATVGIFLGPPGLGLCVVGVILTGVAYRQFDDYVNPGPYRVEESTCTLEELRATFGGTITNLDDRERDYELVLQFLDGSAVVSNDRVRVDDVDPGEARPWSSSGRVGEIDLACRVRRVTGPYPFGLDPND